MIMASDSDAHAYKQQQRDDWAEAASHWRRLDDGIRRTSAETTPRLLELAGVRTGDRVLDIASGTGEPGLPAAKLVGPSGFVLLTDQSPEMLAVAREKARTRDLHNVDFVVSDAEQLMLDPESFDAALCRGALCLMPDPVGCLRVVYTALRPEGRLAVLVVGRPEANPYFTTPFAVLAKHTALPQLDPEVPGPFRFADPERLQSVMVQAGFHDVGVEQFQHVHSLGTGREYWAHLSRISAVAKVLAKIPTDQHEGIGEEIAARAAGGDPDSEVALKAESNLAVGVR